VSFFVAPVQAQDAPKGLPTAVIVRGPEVGQRAPQFALQWATKDTIAPVGEPFRLADNLGKVVVLAFYPRDFTRGCTAQFQEFAKRRDELFGPDVVVVGISADSLHSHQRFARSLDLPFMLLSDPDQAVSRKYGSAGDAGLNRRTVYVLSPDGKVAWRDMGFIAVDPKAYQELGRAVAAARK
jgi:peroxiredoxin Q/BCP